MVSHGKPKRKRKPAQRPAKYEEEYSLFMNIEIANRLVNLRKSHNLSQEALAEKLGISRQAVSKWERAEASPDTDNLIMLARLYEVSLDELLKTEDEIPEPEEAEGEFQQDEQENPEGEKQEDYVHVGFRGIHVKDQNGEVHVGWDGIHVDDKGKGDKVDIDKNGVYVNGQRQDKHWFEHHAHFPVFLILIITYLIIGSVWGAWHPGWLLFLLGPIWYSLIEAVEKKNASHFAYPVLAALIFLCLGFFAGLWHPGWVIFLTIPVYYSLVEYIKHMTADRSGGEQNEE